MDRDVQLAVFTSQTENVRRLEAARRQVKRAINAAMRKGDVPAEEAHSAVMALLYCAWLEALFVKITHTPYGFDIPELEAIRREQEQSGIHEAWRKCLEVGLKRVSQGPKSNELPNIELHLRRLVDTYVQEPAQLRNKIAHGQWAVALNRSRTAVNANVTAQIQALDIVTVDIWFEAANHLAEIIEALIESPARHFRGAYWVSITKLEEKLATMATWSRQSRAELLRKKPAESDGR